MVKLCTFLNFDDDDVSFLEESAKLNLPIKTTTISSLADTRHTNREKVIAEAYWQHMYEDERQKKT
jgi:hypothetical protein